MKICNIPVENKRLGKRTLTIVEMVEQNNNQGGIDIFVKEFLLQLSRNPEIANSYLLTNESARQNLIMRVSKILVSEQDLEVDEELFNSLPVNSDDPQFLASEVFRDTLLMSGLEEETAEKARKYFLALKKDKLEETQNLFFKVS
jgi:hypothetical protein